MLKKSICMFFCLVLFTGCITDTELAKGENTQIDQEETTKKTEEFTQEELMEEAAIQDEEGMPYMNPRDFPYIYDGYNPEFQNPWDTYNLLDSVIILTIEDMQGSKTFIDGDVYSFVNKEGRNTSPAKLPINGKKAKVAHLYVSKTEATTKLKKDDVIALEAVLNQTHGVIQKIVEIHITGEVVHLITRAPQPDEIWGTPRLKERN